MRRLVVLTVFALAACDATGGNGLGVDRGAGAADLSSTDLALLTCTVPQVAATSMGADFGPVVISGTPTDVCVKGCAADTVLFVMTEPTSTRSVIAMSLFESTGYVAQGDAFYDPSTSMGFAEVKMGCDTSDTVVLRAYTTDGSTQQATIDFSLGGY